MTAEVENSAKGPTTDEQPNAPSTNNSQSKGEPAATATDNEPIDTRDALEVLESEAKEWEKDAEIDRILQAFRLDAYAVLGLKPGVAESDIKATYRKKSLLIHPDKTKNARAPDAFDRLKKAQVELMDEKHRAVLDEAIADARMLLMRDRKWTADSPETRTAEFDRLWAAKSRDVLIDNEARRRRQTKAQMQEQGREQRRLDEESDRIRKKRQHDQDWEATRDQRISSWRQFQKGKGAGDSSGGTNTTGGGGGGGGGDEGEPKKKKKKLKPIG